MSLLTKQNLGGVFSPEFTSGCSFAARKYCREWKISRWVLWIRTWLQLYQLPNLSDHSDKQETWMLMMVCEECESAGVQLRTTQYAWTYVTSCDNPS